MTGDHLPAIGQPIETRCAWCDQEARKQGQTPPNGPNVSHGICPRHEAEVEAQYGG
jgi:hypothetical protein